MPTQDDDGDLPETGLSANLLPLGVLSALLIVGGLVLVRRGQLSRSQHPGQRGRAEPR